MNIHVPLLRLNLRVFDSLYQSDVKKSIRKVYCIDSEGHLNEVLSTVSDVMKSAQIVDENKVQFWKSEEDQKFINAVWHRMELDLNYFVKTN